jgi:hypothetical protein
VIVSDYLHTIKERLLTDSAVASFRLIREKATLVDGYMRARLVLADESYLEFAEYVQVVDETIQVVTYSYHWATSDNRLLRRWDNTPHFPHVPDFPHHIHQGEEVVPGRPVDIFVVLDEIAQSSDFHP